MGLPGNTILSIDLDSSGDRGRRIEIQGRLGYLPRPFSLNKQKTDPSLVGFEKNVYYCEIPFLITIFLYF